MPNIKTGNRSLRKTPQGKRALQKFQPLTIFLIEKNKLIEQAIEKTAKQDHGLKIVQVENEWRSAVSRIKIHAPDAVIVDSQIYQPTDPPLYELKAALKTTKFGLLMDNNEKLMIFHRVVNQGFDGILSEQWNLPQLAKALHCLVHEGWALPRALTGIFIEQSKENRAKHATTCGLTYKEMDVLKICQETPSVKDAAEILGLSIHTVNVHKKHIFYKLGAHCLIEALEKAKERGIIL